MRIASIIIYLLLIISSGQSQELRDSVLFQNEIFEGIYSEKLEQPIWISYNVFCHQGKATRKNKKFYVPDGVHTSDNLDYINNIWDKGHMVPAADFTCSEGFMELTFSYLNCALQHQSLNRGKWRELERYERELANDIFEDVHVEIEIHFSEFCKKTAGGATIPYGFTKHITTKDGTTICFFFINEPALRNLMYYRILCKDH